MRQGGIIDDKVHGIRDVLRDCIGDIVTGGIMGGIGAYTGGQR